MTSLSAPPRTSVRVSVNVPWDAPRCSPYVRRLYAELIDHGIDVQSVNDEHGPPDILHMHWPEACLGDRNVMRAVRDAARTIAGCARRKAKGTKVLWTVHNLQHHEHFHPRLERVFWSVFTRLVDGAIHLSEPARAAALDRHPHLRRRLNAVIPHGHFVDDYPDPPAQADARARYGIAADADVTLFFGQIRPYKNVVELIRAFSQVPDPGALLIIAGPPTDPRYAREVTAVASTDPRIDLLLGYVEDADVPWRFAACDRVALPFTDILNSGSALLALSMSRPVVSPRVPLLAWMARMVGHEWFTLYVPPLDHVALRMSTDRHAPAPLAAFSWTTTTGDTVDFYERLLAGIR